MNNLGRIWSTFLPFLRILIKIQWHYVIAPGLSYLGMKGQNIKKDKERDNTTFKNPTFIYPVGAVKVKTTS